MCQRWGQPEPSQFPKLRRKASCPGRRSRSERAHHERSPGRGSRDYRGRKKRTLVEKRSQFWRQTDTKMVFCLDVDKANDGTTQEKENFPTFPKTWGVEPIPCVSLFREKKNVFFAFDLSLSLFCTESQTIGSSSFIIKSIIDPWGSACRQSPHPRPLRRLSFLFRLTRPALCTAARPPGNLQLHALLVVRFNSGFICKTFL